MKEFIVDLSTLVNPPHTNMISGRDVGEKYAENKEILRHINDGDKIVIIIDNQKIKAINDSFIKGFFNLIFKQYKKYEIVNSFTEIRSDPEYKSLFEKNWRLLDILYNV